MPNIDPIYSKQADIQSGGVVIGSSANTAQDGTGSNITSIFQADPTSGGYLQRLRIKSVGSPAATVMRVFICSVTGAFTPGTSNTALTAWLYDEISIPAITLSQTISSPALEVLMNTALPPGYRILVTFGTSTGVAGTGFIVTGIGGKY